MSKTREIVTTTATLITEQMPSDATGMISGCFLSGAEPVTPISPCNFIHSISLPVIQEVPPISSSSEQGSDDITPDKLSFNYPQVIK